MYVVHICMLCTQHADLEICLDTTFTTYRLYKRAQKSTNKCIKKNQSVGPGGLATPGTGGCLRALPQQSDALLAFRADGGVVWSTDGAPLAHPVSCLL